MRRGLKTPHHNWCMHSTMLHADEDVTTIAVMSPTPLGAATVAVIAFIAIPASCMDYEPESRNSVLRAGLWATSSY